eukprot:15013543-Alexandrium_andersonii.AAC.1
MARRDWRSGKLSRGRTRWREAPPCVHPCVTRKNRANHHPRERVAGARITGPTRGPEHAMRMTKPPPQTAVPPGRGQG